MKMIRLVLLCLPWLGACTPQEAPVPPEQPNEPPAPMSDAVLFEGGRLIVGDGNTIETRLSSSKMVVSPRWASRAPSTHHLVQPE